MEEDDKPIWEELGKTAEGFMRDALSEMKENAPIPSWKKSTYVDWYYEADYTLNWCWIGPYHFLFLTKGDAYVPKIPGWGALKRDPFCDCGDRNCLGGLIAD